MTYSLRALCLSLLLAATVCAHPLGQQSINYFARIATDVDRVEVRYVVDLAELPTYQEAQSIDADGNGQMSQAELDAYLARVAPNYRDKLVLLADGARIVLQPMNQMIALLTGDAGTSGMGLATLRLVFDLAGAVTTRNSQVRFQFADENGSGRGGWREVIVAPLGQATLYNSTAFADSATNELRNYPADVATAPLNERAAEWSATRDALPSGARPLLARNGQPVTVTSESTTTRVWSWGVGIGVLVCSLVCVWLWWRRRHAAGSS